MPIDRSTITLAELRDAYGRAIELRMMGFSFAEALRAPTIRKSMELSAVAHRRAGQPVQCALTLEAA